MVNEPAESRQQFSGSARGASLSIATADENRERDDSDPDTNRPWQREWRRHEVEEGRKEHEGNERGDQHVAKQ
jgi:hypothetical protein